MRVPGTHKSSTELKKKKKDAGKIVITGKRKVHPRRRRTQALCGSLDAFEQLDPANGAMWGDVGCGLAGGCTSRAGFEIIQCHALPDGFVLIVTM